MVCVLPGIRLHRVSCNVLWLTGNAGRPCVAQRIEDLTMADSYSQLWGLQHSNVTRSFSLSLSRNDKMQNIINIQTLWDCLSSNLDHDGHVRHVRVSQNKFYTKSVCTPFWYLPPSRLTMDISLKEICAKINGVLPGYNCSYTWLSGSTCGKRASMEHVEMY